MRELLGVWTPMLLSLATRPSNEAKAADLVATGKLDPSKGTRHLDRTSSFRIIL